MHGIGMSGEMRSRRGRPTKDELEKRKRRVLDVAEQVFIQRGYTAATLSEIAEISGVSPRLLSNHLGKKSDIFLEIINSRVDQVSQMTLDAHAGLPLDELLFKAAQFAWTMAYAPVAVSFSRLLIGEVGHLDISIRDIAKKASIHYSNTMEQMFAKIIGKGHFSGHDPGKISRYFSDLIIGYHHIQAAMGYWDGVPTEDELKDKIRFFCKISNVTA